MTHGKWGNIWARESESALGHSVRAGSRVASLSVHKRELNVAIDGIIGILWILEPNPFIPPPPNQSNIAKGGTGRQGMDLDAEKTFQDLMVSRYLARTLYHSPLLRRGVSARAIELIGSTVAAITLYFYEWFLVFNDEIELLGTARFSMGKILYYFVGDFPSHSS
jgi:hypothetical protein